MVVGVPPVGLEPTLLAPEASALSSELRGPNRIINIATRAVLYKFGHWVSETDNSMAYTKKIYI